MADHRQLLLVAHLPPPLHGASFISKEVLKVSLELFDVKVISLSPDKNLTAIEKIRFALKLVLNILSWGTVNRPSLSYFTPNVRGAGLYRDVIITLCLKLVSQRLVLHLHGLGIKERSCRLFFKLLYRAMFSSTTLIHVSKSVLDDELSNLSGIDVRREYLDNAVDVDYIINVQESVKAKHNSTPHIVYMAHFKQSKGTFDVLVLAKMLKQKKISTRVTMVGAFRHKNFEMKCKQYINEHKLESIVSLIGPKYDRQKIEVLSSGDIFVYPTYNDSFGIVLIEAMCCGLPAITYKEGATSEIVETGRHGFVLEKGNVDGLFDRLCDLIHDKRKCRTFGVQARKKVREQYGLSSFRSKVARILSETAP